MYGKLKFSIKKILEKFFFTSMPFIFANPTFIDNKTVQSRICEWMAVQKSHPIIW